MMTVKEVKPCSKCGHHGNTAFEGAARQFALIGAGCHLRIFLCPDCTTTTISDLGATVAPYTDDVNEIRRQLGIPAFGQLTEVEAASETDGI